jgi:nucleotide-binding universal stress UspA family protein
MPNVNRRRIRMVPRRPLFKHILVPLDLSQKNSRALRAAVGIAVDNRARVTLLHVIERVLALAPRELSSFYRRLAERSERTLRQVARKFSAEALAVRVDVRIGVPAREIVRATMDKRVDLVIMGSHRVRPGKGAAGWGTTSYKVGIFCQCPILLVK